MVEPWLRGTLGEFDAVRRQVLHALELTGEDAAKWCFGLSDEEMNATPFGLPSVAFHLRHIARSLDRLLTYAEGLELSSAQRDELLSEHSLGEAGAVFDELRQGLGEARRRIERIGVEQFEAARGVGRERLPATVGGLLVHCAEHTQRHAGQAITTAKVVVAQRVRI